MLKLFEKYNEKMATRKIDRSFKKQLGRLVDMVKSGKRNEEETRRWCVDVIRDGLGYKDAEIETESKVLGQRVDIALKASGHIFMVVECKAASVKLNKSAIHQAATYAVGLGAEWAVVTNGQRWRLFHVSPTQGVEPDVTEIFDISILDEDGVSDDDVYCLSLLRKESIFSGETKRVFHDINAVSSRRLREVFLHPEMMTSVCRMLEDSYRKNMGVAVSVSHDTVVPFVEELFEIARQIEE